MEENVIFKLEVEISEVEISKLKLRVLKSRPELGITNVANQYITPAFCNSPNLNSKNKKFDYSNETTVLRPQKVSLIDVRNVWTHQKVQTV